MSEGDACGRCGQRLKSHETISVANPSGRITWDPERAGEVPLLVIDGKPCTWDQVGRMLMSFEGFTLRAFVSDSIEVIGGPLSEEEEEDA